MHLSEPPANPRVVRTIGDDVKRGQAAVPGSVPGRLVPVGQVLAAIVLTRPTRKAAASKNLAANRANCDAPCTETGRVGSSDRRSRRGAGVADEVSKAGTIRNMVLLPDSV